MASTDCHMYDRSLAPAGEGWSALLLAWLSLGSASAVIEVIESETIELDVRMVLRIRSSI
jgi:hypothetical protein